MNHAKDVCLVGGGRDWFSWREWGRNSGNFHAQPREMNGAVIQLRSIWVSHPVMMFALTAPSGSREGAKQTL